jgi:hypothetical protein
LFTGLNEVLKKKLNSIGFECVFHFQREANKNKSYTQNRLRLGNGILPDGLPDDVEDLVADVGRELGTVSARLQFPRMKSFIVEKNYLLNKKSIIQQIL